ncbi:heme o synthase [Malassezia sp. CBS 17886]|nr:heme o synthase [Malassezia sp. CBS 17886]
MTDAEQKAETGNAETPKSQRTLMESPSRTEVPPPHAEDRSRTTEVWQSMDDPSQPLVSPTAEQLLKQRFVHAQRRTPGCSFMVGGSGLAADVSSLFGDQHTRPGADAAARAPGAQARAESDAAAPSDTAAARAAEDTSFMVKGGATPLDDMEEDGLTPAQKAGSDALSPDDVDDGPEESASSAELVPYVPRQNNGPFPSRRTSVPSEQPFDTHVFVKRLEDGGWEQGKWTRRRQGARGDGHGGAVPSAAAGAADRPSPDHAEEVPGASAQPSTGAPRRHDPAEAIMDLTRALLHQRGTELEDDYLGRSDLDNQYYLFSSALSELRTEVRVRARNDGAALRSLTSLLQREVEALTQRLQGDMERLKHDIQVDMNNRKTEVKDDNNNLDQEIQDLNNRFTIFLSDLKTEIEQSIKWDATRRALALVVGIVAILVITLALADYLSREEKDYDAGDARRELRDGRAADGRTPVAARGARSASLGGQHAQDGAPLPPKSAEEWGLVPRYETDEVRYV